MPQDEMHVFCARIKLYKDTVYRSFRPGFNLMIDLVVVKSDLYVLTKV